MATVKVYNQVGDIVREQALDDAVFGVRANPTLVHDVVVAMQSNRRQVTAHTKTRGEVRGGGKKPWKQKGTGRARQGSTRAPQWKGGGVVFGPRADRNYTKKINAKVRQAAMRMCLTDKVASQQLVLVDSLRVPERKTKAAASLLRALKIPLNRRHAAVVVSPTGDGDVLRAVRNISSVQPARVETMNVLDLLTYAYLVTTPEEVLKIQELFRAKKK